MVEPQRGKQGALPCPQRHRRDPFLHFGGRYRLGRRLSG